MDQTLATSLPSPSIPSVIQAHLRLLSAVTGMAGSGSESFSSRSVNPKLISHVPEEEMDIRLALRRAWEEARTRLRSDYIRRESIASAQMMHGSGARPTVAASLEAVRSVCRPNAAFSGAPYGASVRATQPHHGGRRWLVPLRIRH